MSDAAPVATLAWVIGARGLLGSALVRQIAARPGWAAATLGALDWSADLDRLAAAASDAAHALVADAGARRVAVIWCGGRGVTSTTAEEFANERAQLRVVLSAVEEALRTRDRADDVVFYASSAGGVYAGSSGQPFTERTVPRPISAYGESKLQSEALVVEAARAAGVSSVNGRISNLYGPGQSLTKLQGLVSHVARASFTRRPVSIYVPLDTLRDYLYVTDAARLVCDCVDRAAGEASRSGLAVHATKILASGVAATIAEILGNITRITHRRAEALLASSPLAAGQSLDIRLRSVVWPDLDRRELTPFPAGIAATIEDVRRRTTVEAV